MFSKNHPKVSMLKASATAGIIGLMLAATGCSASPQTEASVALVPSASASPTASENAKPSSAPVATASTPISSGLGDMAIAGDVVSTNKGKYRQVKLPDNSPAYALGKGVVAENASAGFTSDDIQAGTKSALDYMVKDIIDPPVIDSELDPGQWWKTAEADFVPQYAPDAFASLGSLDKENQTSDSLVIENPWWANKEYKGFSYIYNEDETRIKNLNMKVTSVTRIEGSANLVVEANVSYEIPAVYAAVAGGKADKGAPLHQAVQHTSGMIKLAVAKDASGKWLMSGWEKNVNSPVSVK